MMALISGSSLLTAVLWIVVAGVCWWLLNWLIDYAGIPEPFHKVAKIILAVAAVVILINALLSVVGHPFIAW